VVPNHNIKQRKKFRHSVFENTINSLINKTNLRRLVDSHQVTIVKASSLSSTKQIFRRLVDSHQATIVVPYHNVKHHLSDDHAIFNQGGRHLRVATLEGAAIIQWA
jgi:hypothetical protein